MKKRCLTINQKEYQVYSGFLYDVNYYIRLKQCTSIYANKKRQLEIDELGLKTTGWTIVANIKRIGYKNTFRSYAELQDYLECSAVNQHSDRLGKGTP